MTKQYLLHVHVLHVHVLHVLQDTCFAVETCDELYHFTFSIYSEIDHIHLSSEAQCDSDQLPPGGLPHQVLKVCQRYKRLLLWWSGGSLSSKTHTYSFELIHFIDQLFSLLGNWYFWLQIWNLHKILQSLHLSHIKIEQATLSCLFLLVDTRLFN